MIKDIFELLQHQEAELTHLIATASELAQRSFRLRTLIEQRMAQAEKDLLVLTQAVEGDHG